MGISDEVASSPKRHLEGSVAGDAMMMVLNYGMSNEGGQRLARELLARELQARELLAREMGSQADSQASRRRRPKSSRSGRSTIMNRPYALDSSNISLDGSAMSRSRWEPEPRGSFQHETSSLPAAFLYFKFEQIVARWAKQKSLSSVMSFDRLRPRHNMNRPPRTITTIAIPAPTPPPPLAIEEEKNLPRFMRNTTTSATKFAHQHHQHHNIIESSASRDNSKSPSRARSTSSSSYDRNRQQQPEQQPPKRANSQPSSNRDKPAITAPSAMFTPTSPRTTNIPNSSNNNYRRQPSPSTARYNNTDRRKMSPAATKGNAPFRSSSSLRMTEPPLREQPSETIIKNKKHSNLRVQTSSSNTPTTIESRLPQDTSEQSDASHYVRRESTTEELEQVMRKGNRPPTYSPQPINYNHNKPDPEGPCRSSRPDPDGERWPSPPRRPMRHPSPLRRSPSPIGRSPSPMPNKRMQQEQPSPSYLPPQTPTSDDTIRIKTSNAHDSTQRAESSARPSTPAASSRSPSPAPARKPSTTPVSSNRTGSNSTTPVSSNRTGGRNFSSPTATRNSSSPAARKASPGRPTTPRPTTTSTANRNPSPDTKKKTTTRTPVSQTSEPPRPTTRRRKSRLPPLPSFRNPSPKPQQKQEQQQAHKSPRRQGQSPTSTGNNEKQPSSPNGARTPTRSGTNSPRNKNGATSTSPKNAAKNTINNNSPSPRTPNSSGRTSVATDRLHQEVRATTNTTKKTATKRQGTTSPRSPTVGAKRRYGRVHIHRATVLQSHFRMLPHRRKFFRIRRSIIVLQSQVRRRMQIKAFKQAKKGTRIQNFSSIVIQKNYRMISCRLSYLQLRHAVIVAQSAVRMFACQSAYAELRSASKRLLGRSSLRASPKTTSPATPKPQVVTVRGGRLRIYSALLIQSLVRMRWVRGAYLELRASAQVIQKWFRKVHTVIIKQRRAAIVLQSWARMLSLKSCYLDLRESVIFLQKWTRMVCTRSRYLREKRLRLEHASATLIQSLCRRDSCRAAYHQLRTSAASLQRWARGRAIRIAFVKISQATVVLQCWVRQRISERVVLELSRAVLIQATFRAHLLSHIFATKRICAIVIQAAVRGFLYRERYLSLKLAAIVVQTRRRGALALVYVSVRRSALWFETEKLKRSNHNVTPLSFPPEPREDDVKEERSPTPTRMKNRPDPIVIETGPESSDTVSELGSSELGLSDTSPDPIEDTNHDLIDTSSSKHQPQYDDVVSAALAFVSHSPSHSLKRAKGQSLPSPQKQRNNDPTPRRSQRCPSPLKASKGALPQHDVQAIEKTDTHSTQKKNDDLVPDNESIQSLRKPRDCSPHFVNVATKTATTDATKKKKTRDPAGDNMSRLPPVSSRASDKDLEDPKSPEPTATNEMTLHPPNFSPPQLPKQTRRQNQKVPFDYRQSSKSWSSGQPQGPSPPLPMSYSIPNDLVPAPPEMIARMSPVELSPSQQQPLYFVSRSSDGSPGSPKLYALQPLTELPPLQPQNPHLYFVSNSQTNYQHPFRVDMKPSYDTEPKMGLKSSILEGLKRERTKKRETTHKQQSSIEREYPPIPSIADNPSYYLPKAELKKHGAKENDPRSTSSTEADESDEDISLQEDDGEVFLGNPLKQVIVQNRHNDGILLPKLKKDDTCSEKAISEKLAAIKQRSRARKVHRWTNRTLKRDKTPAEPNGRADDKRGTKVKRAFLDIAVEQWAKQTIQRRKLSIITSEWNAEVALQIQSAWRSHRDQLHLASLLIQTWSVCCDFTPDTMHHDRLLKQNANILALDGAFSQVGYLPENSKMLVKKGLVMVQWEGLVPIQFSDHGLPADDTCCTVSVHCTASVSRLLFSWSENKRCNLLTKAAIAKYCGDQRQKLRRSSIFERSLSRRRADYPTPPVNHNDHNTPARQLAELRRGYKHQEENISRRHAIVIQRAFRKFQSRKFDEEEEERSSYFLGVPDDFQDRMRVYSAVLIQSWYRMCVCRSMYQGLRRIQSRVLLLVEKDEAESVKFHRYFPKHRCETIVEEEGGFECTTGSNET